MKQETVTIKVRLNLYPTCAVAFIGLIISKYQQHLGSYEVLVSCLSICVLLNIKLTFDSRLFLLYICHKLRHFLIQQLIEMISYYKFSTFSMLWKSLSYISWGVTCDSCTWRLHDIFQVSKHALDINLIINNDDDNNKIHDNDIGRLPWSTLYNSIVTWKLELSFYNKQF